jgi:predicted dehydrogenase
MKKKIGVLGLGSIGSRHLRNFKELGCEVRGYDPQYAGQGDHGPSRMDVIHWADALVIASPTECHMDGIMESKKPMLVEKPIVGMRSQWNRVETDHVLMVGYNLRFHSCVQKAKEWLLLIGKPLWARFTCAQYNDKPAYLRDGVILNWSHEIDLAIYLLGGASFLHCCKLGGPPFGDANTSEFLADITLLHNYGQSTIHLDYITRWERRGFLIVGEKGSIEADLVQRQVFLRDNTGRFVDTYYGRDSWDGNYLAEARAFLERLDGKEAPGCTAQEAMKVADICLQARSK